MKRVLERCQRRADDSHAVRMRPGGQLPVPGDDVIGGWRRLSLGDQDRSRPANVVDAHHQHYLVGARLGEHVAVEAGKCVDAHAVAQRPGA
jgi:hypothetical protein